MIKVMVVDDDGLICQAVARLLEDQPNIEVIAKANSGEEAVRLTKEKIPDVILMDIKMPGIGGIQAIHQILSHNPDIRVIALTAYTNELSPGLILKAGGKGCLTKGSDSEKMLQAICAVACGKTYLDLDSVQQLTLKSLPSNESHFDLLSGRELNIMMMITNGINAQAIAKKLHLSPKTINTYRYRIFEKLNVKNDVDLTLFATRNGLLNKDDR